MGDEMGTRTRTLREINEALDKLARRTEADRERAEADREEDRKRAEADRKEDRKRAEADRKEDRKRAEADRKEDRKRAEADRERLEREWREIRERSAQLDEQLAAVNKEAAAQSREADKRMRELNSLFNDERGKLVERLAKGRAAEMFQEWGVGVKRFAKEGTGPYDGKEFQFDAILENGDEVVVIEVKSTLTSRKTEEFIWKLERFTEIMPRYAGSKIYGAAAFLKANEGMDVNCQRRGLFVIKAVGDGAVLLNKPKGVFAPREFSGRAKS